MCATLSSERATLRLGARSWKRCWRLVYSASLLALVGCASLTQPRDSAAQSPFSIFAPAKPVGTPEWWKQNKSRAEFVVGKGFQVPGAEGFFDDQGRPISEPVAPLAQVDPVDDTLLGSLAPETAYTKLATAVGRGPDEQIARELLGRGEALFAEKKFADAAVAFKDASQRAPNGDVHQEALFKMAESYFFADEYADANDAYEKLLKDYAGTSYLDKVIGRKWSIAQYWQKRAMNDPEWPTTPNLIDKTRPGFDTLGWAIKVYDSIRMNDPTGPWADDALMATASSYFTRGRFEDADYHFELLRRDYPKSEHQFQAHILGLQCKLRIYQGPEYDGTALEEAEKLTEQLRLQFGATLDAEQRQRFDTIAAQIAKHRALRDWRMAEYYENQERFGAARFYFGRLIQQHPRSELATQAREHLAEIADKPATPPERMTWLMEMFPESRERRRMANVPVVNSTTR